MRNSILLTLLLMLCFVGAQAQRRTSPLVTISKEYKCDIHDGETDGNNLLAGNAMFMAQKLFEKEKYEAALKGERIYLGFIDIYDQYKRTKAGKLAAYYAGICYLRLGQYQDAIDYLQKYTTRDDVIYPMALGAIGDCYMELDDLDKAVNYYEKAAQESKNGFTGPMFLDKAAKTYEILGDYPNALKCYKALKSDYPVSNEAFEINKTIANIEQKMKY